MISASTVVTYSLLEFSLLLLLLFSILLFWTIPHQMSILSAIETLLASLLSQLLLFSLLLLFFAFFYLFLHSPLLILLSLLLHLLRIFHIDIWLLNGFLQLPDLFYQILLPAFLLRLLFYHFL